MAYIPPTLSEFAQSDAQNQGLGPAIASGTAGLASGIGLAQRNQQLKQEFQAKLAELGIGQQNANTAQAAEQSKQIPVERAEHMVGAAPGTFGPTGSTVHQDSITNYVNNQTRTSNLQATLAAAQANKEAALAAANAQQEEKLKEAKYQADLASSDRLNQATNAAVANVEKSGGFFNSIFNRHGQKVAQTQLDQLNSHGPVSAPSLSPAAQQYLNKVTKG